MAKKLTVKELEAARKAINKDEEDEKKAKAKAAKTAAPVYTYKEAGSKVSPPAVGNIVTPIGTAAPGANKNIVPIPTAMPEKNGYTLLSAGMPQRADIGLLHPDLVRKYLEQGMAYAQQGPQSRQQIADSLLGFDIGDHAKGAINSFSMDAMQEQSIRNRYFIDQHQQAGTFDFPEFITDRYITFPSTDYLTKQGDATLAALEESKKKDDADKWYQSNLQSTRGAWEQLEAEKNNPYMFDPMYGYAMMEYLQGDRSEPFNFDQWDYEYQNLSPADQKARLADLQKQWNGLDFDALTGRNYSYESQTPALQAKYDLISGQLQNRNKAAELEDFVRSQPDFDEKRRYVDNYTAPEKGSLEYIFSNDAFVQGLDDPLRYMHSDVNWANRELAGEYSGKAKYYFEHGYHLMAPEQLDTYTYLYQSGRTKEAADYLAAIQPELNKAMSDIITEFYTTRDETIPGAIIDSLWSVPGKIKGTLDTGAGVLMGKDDPNDPLYRTAQNVDTIRGVSGQTAGELLPFEIFGQKAGTFLYGLGMSTLDMIAAQKLAGIFGVATGKVDTMKNIMGAIMATEVGTDTFRGDLERGMGFEYSLGHGIANGLVNRWAESGFLYNLFSENGKFLTRVLKSGAYEGLEEVFESGMNLGTDAFVSYLAGKQSEIEQTYNYYVATVGKDKAAAATMQHYANQFAADGLAGFIMGGTTSGVYNTGEYLDTRAAGKAVTKGGDIDTIIGIAKGMAEDSESKRIADEITGKQGKGKKPSFYQFGQLTKAIVKDLGEERAAIVNRVQDEAIVERLVELGEDRTAAKQNASIIRRIARGEKVPRQEMFEAKWSDNASQVVKELTRETKDVESFAPGAVEDVGAREIGGKWVEGNTQEAEANRTGNKWVTDMQNQQRAETENVRGKQIQVQVATITPIGKAANRAEEAAKQRVPKHEGNPKLATDSHVTFRSADGSAEVSGDIMRFEESDEGMQVVVQTGKGKEGEQKVKLEDWISADGDGVATILSYIGDEQLPHSVTAEEANTLMQVYKHSGGNAKAVIQAFDVNYLAGYSGNDQVGSVLDPALSKIAYENGKRDAEKDEAQRKQRASEYKALENPVAGWIGKVDGREQVKGMGDAKALEEALQAMPESQRTAAEIMIETGKAVGLNVVLYDSDGKGAANDIQNGMFDAVTHTVYYDVSAWVGNTKQLQAMKKQGTLGYAMLRVGGHELTHYLEVAAPEAYAKYSKAVKDALKAKGVDFAVQMRERIDKANAQGRKLTMAGAAAEVIADASENMLQDSKLFNNLDTDTKGKIRAFLQNFAQKVKEIFQHLTGGHKESAALREMKNGVYHYLEGLQDLWDAGFDEILAKGTEEQSGGTTEMVEGVQFSDREDQTETETFKRWFGDSVVVNRDGTPKVMYHGSKENFTVFDKSILKDKLGFFFTEDKQEAQDYGTARSFYLSIKNPYDIWDGLENYGKTSEEKVKGLKDAGYDGIISYSHGTTWYIAFEPTQIKSATGNVGTFDPENPDIRYSDRDLPDGVTIRDYLAESDDSIAETVEERNALTIYQKLLKNHAEASEAVMAAEQALETAPESQKAEVRKTLSAARAKQRDLYNRLLNVERTAHVQSVISRANQFMAEELQGKTREAVEKAIADREAKIAELKADLTGLKGAAKTQREADIRQHERIVARFKSKAAQMVLDNSEKYERQIADIRERRDLNIEIGNKARHIKRVVKALNNRIVHEDDYKNVKEPLKPAVHTLVRTFLDGFGNLVFDQKTADKLKSVYDVLAQDDATAEYYDDEVSDWLTTLANLSRQDEERRAGGVTLESLNDKLYIYTTLADIADHVAHMVTAADTMFMEGRKASVSGVTDDIGNTLLAKEDRRELVGSLGKAANFVDNLIIRGNMMPQFFFEGLNNKGMMQLYDGLQDGVRMYSERLLTGENFLEDAMRRYGYHTWRDMDKVVEFKTQQGHTIHLKRENMMWIYATAKREASNPLMDTHHLDEGGFVYEESSTPTSGLFKAKGHQKHHKIVQEDVEAITAMLTAEQIAFMDECVEFLSTECADWGNEASMQLFGIKKYKEKYYFPFKVDGGQLYKNSAAGSTSTTNDARVKHISFSHSIKKGANTPLVMGEFTSVIADHINQMATYSGLVVPIENMNRVLNRKVDDDGDMVTIRSLLGRKYGSPSSKYVDDLLKDLNGGPQTDNRGTWDAGIRLFKKNAVVGKMSVAIQQPTAITRAFAYINPRWFVNLHMERPKETWERMMKYSGTAVLKDMCGFNVGLGQGAKNWIERGDLGDYNVFKRSKFLLDQKGFKAAKDEWVDFLTGLPGWMDKVTWVSIWNAAENEQAHQHPGMDRNSDEFLQMVGRRFDDIVNHTQVYDSILSKSQNMRSKNTLAKMATSFMAESTLNMNLAYRAFASRDVKQIGKVVSSLLLNAALGAAAYALVGSWNKDDDDRTWEEKYAVAFAGRLSDNLNPMASIPYLSDIWNKIQGYDVERTDLSYVLDLAEDGMKFFDKMFNPDEALSYRDYENFVGGMFAAATGIPAKNWMGDARRIWNMTHTKTEDAPSSRVWYGILDEILPGRGTNNAAYYERLLAATMDGDKQEMYDLKDYLMATKGVKETSITSGVRDAYKKVYMRGGISKNDAVNFLLANGLASGKTEAERKQSAFEYVDKWEEGTEGYSAYNTLRKAFSDGNSASIQKAWDELEANGWSNDSIGSYVRNTIIKGMVTSGQITTSKATELIRKWYPYKKDKDNIDKPKEWLNSK